MGLYVLNPITYVLTGMLYPVAFHQIIVLNNWIFENYLTGMEAHFHLRVKNNTNNNKIKNNCLYFLYL